MKSLMNKSISTHSRRILVKYLRFFKFGKSSKTLLKSCAGTGGMEAREGKVGEEGGREDAASKHGGVLSELLLCRPKR